MFVAGIDAHATYSVIAIVSNTGQLRDQDVYRKRSARASMGTRRNRRAACTFSDPPLCQRT